MKKLTLALTAAAMVLSTLSAHAGTGKTTVDQDTITYASNYGLCYELKARSAKNQDEKILQMGCDTIIKTYELNLEKKSLLKRIQAIDAELLSQPEIPDDA